MENFIDTDNDQHLLPSFTMIVVASFLTEQKPMLTACQNCLGTQQFNQAVQNNVGQVCTFLFC